MTMWVWREREVRVVTRRYVLYSSATTAVHVRMILV